MSQSGPFLPRCRGAADCLARGRGPCPLFGRDGGVLHGAGRLAGRSASRVGLRQRQAGRGRIAGGLALARTKSPRGGWFDHYHARHAGESGDLSAAEDPEAGLRLPHCTHPGDLLALGGHGVGGGDRKIQGQANRREQSVSLALRRVGRRRHYPCGPLFQRLERPCLAAATWHRPRYPQASSPPDGLSHRQAIGQGRPLGRVEQTAATKMDVGRAIRQPARAS